jgi:hypothetical protein
MTNKDKEIVEIAIKAINLVGTSLNILGAKNIDKADELYPSSVIYPSVPKSAFNSCRIKFQPELNNASGRPSDAYDR